MSRKEEREKERKKCTLEISFRIRDCLQDVVEGNTGDGDLKKRKKRKRKERNNEKEKGKI